MRTFLRHACPSWYITKYCPLQFSWCKEAKPLVAQTPVITCTEVEGLVVDCPRVHRLVICLLGPLLWGTKVAGGAECGDENTNGALGPCKWNPSPVERARALFRRRRPAPLVIGRAFF